MKRRHLRAAGAALAAFLASVFSPALAQSPQIGVTAAVNPAAEGRPPATAPRELRVGVNVVANERIVTTEGGQAQMLFLDESAFSIGPNSDVVLDEFVYDANAGTGKIALSATKGVFRVVGGKISKNTPVELKTPTATIGIRGGIALVNVAPNGATQATFLFGAQMTVSTPGGTQTVQRPGYTVTANTPGGAPSAPVQATTAQLTGTVTALEGQAPPPPGAGPAGGGQAPSDNRVQQTQLTQLGSSNAPQSVAPPGPGAPPPPPPPGPPGAATNTTAQAQQNQTQDSSNLASGLNLSSTFRGTIANALVPTGTVGAGTRFGIGQNGDVTDNTHVFDFTGTATNGKFNASLSEVSGSFSFPIQTGNAFSATLTGNPFGSSTTLSGTGFLFPDKDFFIYNLTPSSGSSKQILFGGIPTPNSAIPTTGAKFYRFLKDPILNSNVPFIPGADGGALFSGQVPGLSDLTTSLLNQSESANAAIYWDKSGSASAQRVFFGVIGGTEGSGSSQSSATSLFIGRLEQDVAGENILNVMFRGSVKRATDTQFRFFSGDAESIKAQESTSGVESDFFGSDGPKYFGLAGNDTDDAAQNSKQMVTEFYQGAAQQYLPASLLIPANDSLGSRTNHLSSGSGINQALQGYATAPGQFVNTSGTETNSNFLSVPFASSASPGNVTIKTSAATNKVKASFFVQDSGSNTISANFGDNDTVFGDSTASAGRSAFIDDGGYGAVEGTSASLFNGQNMGASQLFMFVVDSSKNLPTATYCDCQFTQWGYWGGQMTLGSSGFERLHAGLWVAGVPSLASEISGLTGTATYNGHVIANVQNGSNRYSAAGQIAVGVNFGAPSASTVSITNFDGGGFSGTGLTFLSPSGGKNAFMSGSLSGNGGQGGRNGQIVGSFMRSSSDVAAEVGGQFSAAGTGYSTAGVFAAKK